MTRELSSEPPSQRRVYRLGERDVLTNSGIQTMDAWLETFGTLNAAGEYYLPTSSQSLVVSILSAGVSRLPPPASFL